MTVDIGVRVLHEALRKRGPRLIEPRPEFAQASVSLVLRPGVDGLEVLLIERPVSDHDPWSGHMALPGGRKNPGETSLDAAIRETIEEVGINLQVEGLELGRLDDIRPLRGGPAITVAPFVFAISESVIVQADPREVADTFWISLARLADPACATDHLYLPPDGEGVRFPALNYNGRVIWGLTYRMLTQLLEIVRSIRPDDA
ncbi:MAG: CoA pyrophosphatase [Gemmatimonadota bacterium]|nr:CoA pyrophosphatase [Gemmatimonadota bacterium]